MKEIKGSLKRVDKEWGDFGKALVKAAGTGKKTASKESK